MVWVSKCSPSLAVYKKQTPEMLNMPRLLQGDWRNGLAGADEGGVKGQLPLNVSELAGSLQCVGGRCIGWHRGNGSVKPATQDLGSLLTLQISKLGTAPAFLAKTSHPLLQAALKRPVFVSSGVKRNGGLRGEWSLWFWLKPSQMTSL